MGLFKNRFIIPLLLLSLLPESCFALRTETSILVSVGTLNYSGAADTQTAGSVIGNNWDKGGAAERVFYCGILTFTCTKSYMAAYPGIKPSGMSTTIDGQTYNVYESGVPGVGFIVGVKDTNAVSYIPLYGSQVQTFPAAGTPSTASELGWVARVTFVKTSDHLQSGTYAIPTQNIVTLTAQDLFGDTATSYIQLLGGTLNVTASGCSVNSSDNLSVNMGSFRQDSFPATGSTAGSQSVQVQLLCDAGVTVKAVLSDQSNQTNISNIISLTSDSTAEGIGVQFFYNGSAVNLGPDDSSSGTTNQFLVKKSTSANEMISIPFDVKYIRTGEVNAGSANAIASITFSYQ